jgi:hypothetical protein
VLQKTAPIITILLFADSVKQFSYGPPPTVRGSEPAPPKLLFVASIVVLLTCHFSLSNLDDTYLDKHMKDGYWPPKPIDWNPLPGENNASEKGVADKDQAQNPRRPAVS